ncbi:MAG: 3-dehydro-L-gulonate 2-dehydrogenase [Flavisolibacter sp.]|nr:3-dehydro-L-gulonate 2-dehydrogenase [Flavisolibacter sp.]
MNEMLYIQKDEMQKVFYNILLQHGFTEEKAAQCADIFTANSVDGIYTHGVNRFSRFIQYVKEGYVHPDAAPTLVHAFGGIEQWNGNLGPGPLNAVQATERVMYLAQQQGIGCVALANTNHWMRGGYYGWQAAKRGFVFIGWSNTIANMPAWNAVEGRLGNNPLVVALPFQDEAIVMDMAMSQFSFGTMEQSSMKGEELPVFGGFDKKGELTKNPSEILASGRPVPIGYWKGAGLALLLDILAAILSHGLATYEISKQHSEHGVSQVFIAIDLSKLSNHPSIGLIIEHIISDYKQSAPAGDDKKITYPGEGVLQRRTANLANGIPVIKTIWEEVLSL